MCVTAALAKSVAWSPRLRLPHWAALQHGSAEYGFVYSHFFPPLVLAPSSNPSLVKHMLVHSTSGSNKAALIPLGPHQRLSTDQGRRSVAHPCLSTALLALAGTRWVRKNWTGMVERALAHTPRIRLVETGGQSTCACKHTQTSTRKHTWTSILRHSGSPPAHPPLQAWERSCTWTHWSCRAGSSTRTWRACSSPPTCRCLRIRTCSKQHRVLCTFVTGRTRRKQNRVSIPESKPEACCAVRLSLRGGWFQARQTGTQSRHSRHLFRQHWNLHTTQDPCLLPWWTCATLRHPACCRGGVVSHCVTTVRRHSPLQKPGEATLLLPRVIGAGSIWVWCLATCLACSLCGPL